MADRLENSKRDVSEWLEPPWRSRRMKQEAEFCEKCNVIEIDTMETGIDRIQRRIWGGGARTTLTHAKRWRLSYMLATFMASHYRIARERLWLNQWIISILPSSVKWCAQGQDYNERASWCWGQKEKFGYYDEGLERVETLRIHSASQQSNIIGAGLEISGVRTQDLGRLQMTRCRWASVSIRYF